MNIEFKDLPSALKAKGKGIFRHAKFIFIITILIVSAFLIFEINRLTSLEPSAEQLSTQQEVIKRPKIDQDTINKIEQLEDQNIAVQSLFNEARNNPFQD